jgi:hypothetical protein
MPKRKQEIVSFKVDGALLEAMKGIPNRSEFIRGAILTALDSVCPLCRGTGILTPRPYEHWAVFAKDHAVKECSECHELHLVCSQKRRRKVH